MLYICLSAYNEEPNIAGLFSRLDRLVSEHRYPCRIFAFNDASTDRTQQALSHSSTSIPLEIVQMDKNRGFGYAIAYLIGMVCEQAQDENDVAIFMDADNTHDPESIPLMLAEIGQGADVVIASRFQPASRIYGFPCYRRILSKTASLYFRIILPLANVRDFTSGYRAYRVSTLRALKKCYGNALIQENGFACQVELLFKLQPSSTIEEVPMHYFYDRKLGRSKIKLLSTIVRQMLLGGRIMLHQWRER